MRITANHPASSYGVPVILDDGGSVLDYGPGVALLRRRLGLTQRELAGACGYSVRTVQGWELGRMPEREAVYKLAELLKTRKPKRTKAANP